MLFNSYEFIFLFLPVTLLVFYAAARIGLEVAIAWLVLASLFFYGWWNPVYLVLIIASMVVNFSFGRLLGRMYQKDENIKARMFLAIGVSSNLAVLGYFKYAGFFVENLNAVTDAHIDLGDIALPLAISFFTFQQIAYLVDAYKGIAHEYRFSHYALFVTFFPQLIAGPIVHHKEMLPQFMQREVLSPKIDNIVIGLTIFFIGLFKKAVLADGIARYATPVFASAADGEVLTLFVAWGGVLAYTLQLYFDFSGYSDMAIGGARMFGIRLPLNFHSPYKATNIVEFWRRWHMTLSRFLRDYVYIALGGNRKGKIQRYFNLFATMLLGGLWHGAGWTFVVWGGLHGLYLVINHAWHRFRQAVGWGESGHSRWGKFLAWLITFNAVVVGWVFFRAVDFASAISILESMLGLNGISVPNGVLVRLGSIGELMQSLGVTVALGGGSVMVFTYLWVCSLLVIALIMPNTQQIMSRFEPALKLYQSDKQSEILIGQWFNSHLQWSPKASWAVCVGVVTALAILALTSVSEFLYFQF